MKTFFHLKIFCPSINSRFANFAIQSLLPDGLQVPVNGDVDRKAGGLEEVRPQVPLHDPGLGETHLWRRGE